MRVVGLVRIFEFEYVVFLVLLNNRSSWEYLWGNHSLIALKYTKASQGEAVDKVDRDALKKNIVDVYI